MGSNVKKSAINHVLYNKRQPCILLLHTKEYCVSETESSCLLFHPFKYLRIDSKVLQVKNNKEICFRIELLQSKFKIVVLED